MLKSDNCWEIFEFYLIDESNHINALLRLEYMTCRLLEENCSGHKTSRAPENFITCKPAIKQTEVFAGTATTTIKTKNSTHSARVFCLNKTSPKFPKLL